MIIAVFVFSLSPYVYERIHTPKNMTYVGSFPILLDMPTYIAEMRQGFEGHWQMINRTTSVWKHETQRETIM